MALDSTGHRVHFRGTPGLRLSGLLRQIHDILAIAPTIVLLEIGTNDLASGMKPLSLAGQVVEFAKYLLSKGVRRVVIAQVTFRDPTKSRYPVPENFQAAVTAYNNRVREMTRN